MGAGFPAFVFRACSLLCKVLRKTAAFPAYKSPTWHPQVDHGGVGWPTCSWYDKDVLEFRTETGRKSPKPS